MPWTAVQKRRGGFRVRITEVARFDAGSNAIAQEIERLVRPVVPFLCARRQEREVIIIGVLGPPLIQ